MAVLRAVVGVLQALVAERWATIAHLQKFDENMLAAVFLEVIRKGQEAVILDQDYLSCYGLRGAEGVTARELWQHLVHEALELEDEPETAYILNTITSRGNLAVRILEATGGDPTEEKIQEVYRQLAVCLQQGGIFLHDEPC